MDDGSQLFWLIIILLLLGAMFFAAVETAFASLTRARVKAPADRGDRRAIRALYVLDHMDLAITTILICTNIVHLCAASIVTVHVEARYGEAAVTVSTVLTTFVVFLFGEMLPKSMARNYSTRIALVTGGVLCFLMFILRPVSALLTMIGNAVASLSPKEAESSVTETELRDIIEDMTEEGSLNEEQGDLISSALQFGDVTVESILTSRVDLDAVRADLSPGEVLERIQSSSHSRLPVFEETIDNIIGILQIRTFMKAYLDSGERTELRKLLGTPYFVHQSMRIDDLLKILTEKKLQMAVVTDNYGGTLGIVTVEDILEELVGEIWDEDDKAVRNIVPLSGGAYSVNAAEHVLDIFDEIGLHCSDEEGEALKNKLMSELVFEHCPDMPKEGDSFACYGVRITVLSMKRSRIYRVKVKKLEEEVAEGGETP